MQHAVLPPKVSQLTVRYPGRFSSMPGNFAWSAPVWALADLGALRLASRDTPEQSARLHRPGDGDRDDGDGEPGHVIAKPVERRRYRVPGQRQRDAQDTAERGARPGEFAAAGVERRRIAGQGGLDGRAT